MKSVNKFHYAGVVHKEPQTVVHTSKKNGMDYEYVTVLIRTKNVYQTVEVANDVPIQFSGFVAGDAKKLKVGDYISVEGVLKGSKDGRFANITATKILEVGSDAETNDHVSSGPNFPALESDIIPF